MTNAVIFEWTMFVKCAICVLCLQGILFENCVNSQDFINNDRFQVSTYNLPPVPKPEVLDMVIEDRSDEDEINPHTLLPVIATSKSYENKTISTATSNKTDQTRGRAMNFDETNVKHLHEDLSDVSMDADSENDMSVTAMPTRKTEKATSSCVYGGLTYENEETLEVECNSICKCSNGYMNCTERCSTPFFRKGKKIDDPLCSAQDVDDACCSILVCSSKTESKQVETCLYKNVTYNKNEQIEDGCQSLCSCESEGKVLCKPRCPHINKTSERCVEVPDPKDACCKKVFCDVTLNDQESEKDNEYELKLKLLSANYVNRTALKLDFDADIDSYNGIIEVEISKNKISWNPMKVTPGGYLSNIDSDVRFVRMKHSSDAIPVFDLLQLPKPGAKTCMYKGKTLQLREEFNDNCTSLCVCRENGITCLKIECPTYFGLDVLNPNCIEWETVPKNFVPKLPQCCPEEVRCKSTGSCIYKNETYSNWQQIPVNITGCENRCYCEMGHVECHKICPPVTAEPPNNLECSNKNAVLDHLPEDDCCLYWTCKNHEESKGNNGAVYPGGYINMPPNYHQPPADIIIHTLEALDGHTIRMAFNVPPVLVGLHGRAEVRYTDQNNNDPNTWMLQIFAPPNDLIETPQLEFDLPGLKEDTEYKIKITVSLRDLGNTPTSGIYTVRTLKGSASTTLPPVIPIEPNLAVTNINSTWLNIGWRKFTDYELQFIDGVQIRYREIDGKIYAATPLIHRAVTSYTIENLKENTKYEAGIFFIPFPGQHTELHAEHMIHFTTADEVDIYGFNVTLEVHQVKATSVEIAWTGVPYPEDKYVHIYRAIYQSDSGKGDFSTFKITKRDSPSKWLITDLKPGIRYRLWLEVYLTNGRIKTSNVQDFVTKPRSAPTLGASTQQGKLESEDLSQQKGDYYGPLVIVAILAAISILSTLILLLILVKRYSQNKATISPPTRVSQSAYDNPSYKVEIQQETMNL